MYLCRIVPTSRVGVAVELCPFGRGALMLIIYFHVHVYYQVPGVDRYLCPGPRERNTEYSVQTCKHQGWAIVYMDRNKPRFVSCAQYCAGSV